MQSSHVNQLTCGSVQARVSSVSMGDVIVDPMDPTLEVMLAIVTLTAFCFAWSCTITSQQRINNLSFHNCKNVVTQLTVTLKLNHRKFPFFFKVSKLLKINLCYDNSRLGPQHTYSLVFDDLKQSTSRSEFLWRGQCSVIHMIGETELQQKMDSSQVFRTTDQQLRSVNPSREVWSQWGLCQQVVNHSDCLMIVMSLLLIVSCWLLLSQNFHSLSFVFRRSKKRHGTWAAIRVATIICADKHNKNRYKEIDGGVIRRLWWVRNSFLDARENQQVWRNDLPLIN
jgi:hypothetical protein